MVMETDAPDGVVRKSNMCPGEERSNGGVQLDPKPYTPPSHLVLTPAPECRKLSRGISRATDNEGLVWALRNSADESPEPQLSPDCVFLLPDISLYPHEFRRFIEKDLLETSQLSALVGSGRLNWWAGRVGGARAAPLLPLATSGDGNCLPHAASLAAWGYHDRLLALRSRLQATLAGHDDPPLAKAIYRRWRWAESVSLGACGVRLSEAEWAREWAGALAAAGPGPGPAASCTRTRTLPGLEQLHVLALAHALRRPLLVVADTLLRDHAGRPVAPIPFAGLYLPLCLPPAACSRAPLALSYDAGHFAALVPCDPLPDHCTLLPLTDSSLDLLPIRFSVDPGEDFDWEKEIDQKTINALLPDDFQRMSMLEAYLDLEKVECYSEPEDIAKSQDALATKGSKQLNSVAKQFGSIGRSMSHKIAKNFGSMGKLSKKSSGSSGSSPEEGEGCRPGGMVLCCRVMAGRAPVQDEMVQNYLEDAWRRFTEEGGEGGEGGTREAVRGPRYDTGRSQFYLEAASGAHAAVRTLPARPLSAATPANNTLYLTNSTFYDDSTHASTPPETATVLPSKTAMAPSKSVAIPRIENVTISPSESVTIPPLKSVTLPSSENVTVPSLESVTIPPSPRPCRAPLCLYYGSAEYDHYCSTCAKLHTRV